MLKILRFNWPWYAAALVLNAPSWILLSKLNGQARTLGLCSLLLADVWAMASLAVSHWIYDRSGLTSGRWLDGIESCPQTIAVIHAGHDEASLALRQRFPNARIGTFDFYDPALTPEPSLARARAGREKSPTHAIHLEEARTLPGPVDLACLVFAAHELRESRPRVALISMIASALEPGACLVVVEHLRDGWNFAAYGPGFLHFLSLRTWELTFRASGVRIAERRKITPFVTVFTLELP